MTEAYNANMNRKGDAIFEVSSGTGKYKDANNKSINTTNAWLKQLSIFPNFDHALFKRSGNFEATSTGIFYFNNETGEDLSKKAEPKDSGSFRPILAF